jgi:DNA-binding protein YbaB
MCTRKASEHSLFGSGKKLPDNVLPTYRDIARYFLYLKENTSLRGNNAIYMQITIDVQRLWRKASLPIISEKAIQHKVKRFIDKGTKLVRSKTSTNLTNAYKNQMAGVFDICACQCKTAEQSSSSGYAKIECTCRREEKVPQEEIQFLVDQRTYRKMYIAGIDMETTKKLKKREKRKSNAKDSGKNIATCSSNVSVEYMQPTSSVSDSEVSCIKDSDSDYSDVVEKQMRISLPNVAMQADRFGVSDRAAAAIATATLIDVKAITNMNTELVIDKNKLRRERQKMRKTLQNKQMSDINAIYFDGKKDQTLVKVKINDRWYTEKVIEEHIVLVSEPDSEYLTHKTVASSKSVDTANAILDYIYEKNLQDVIIAVGCDSTNINTGSSAGVITLLEKKLEKPLQRFICMLHTNELPLRHLFQNLDGRTTGATTFSGTIGKALHHCENKPVVQFVAITVGEPLPDLPQHIIDDLSDDQQYLHRIVSAIRSGTIDERLSHLKPGPLCHSRWLTLACRICRLYVSTENVEKNLQLLTLFIVASYAPIWFHIKCKPHCMDGPKHLFSTMKSIKDLPQEITTSVKPYITRNAYFAHSENVLLAMLADPAQEKREKAVNRILQVRHATAVNAAVRIFKVPLINYDASDWDDIISWNTVDVHEPPVTMKMTDFEITAIKETPLILPDYLIHSQNVERYIKLVTEASKSVFGFESRDGYVRSGIHSRKLLPFLDSKKDLKSMISC